MKLLVGEFTGEKSVERNGICHRKKLSRGLFDIVEHLKWQSWSGAVAASLGVCARIHFSVT
jgi:hypothetical protein